MDYPPVFEEHEYLIPKKYIKNHDDMTLWENSVAYHEYMGFVLAINEAVNGKNVKTAGEPKSDVIRNLVTMLDKLDDLITDTPPIDQPQRFGNQAFRVWLDKVNKVSFNLLGDVAPPHLHRGLAEIVGYFMESFGNAVRIDYGTGHETAFVMFLCCLFKMGALSENDKMHVALRVFIRYLDLVRKLQQTYRMEPAGSHGVWSLDDYQFVPFIWGSSQLIAHQRIEPCSFLQNDLVDLFSDEYMFFGCIKYINEVKTGPFAEHSNQLWGVSGVSSWAKVNTGLIRMYKAEVLGKFPVAQHIIFGSLLPFIPFTRTETKRDTKEYMGMSKMPRGKHEN